MSNILVFPGNKNNKKSASSIEGNIAIGEEIDQPLPQREYEHITLELNLQEEAESDDSDFVKLGELIRESFNSYSSENVPMVNLFWDVYPHRDGNPAVEFHKFITNIREFFKGYLQIGEEKGHQEIDGWLKVIGGNYRSVMNEKMKVLTGNPGHDQIVALAPYSFKASITEWAVILKFENTVIVRSLSIPI